MNLNNKIITKSVIIIFIILISFNFSFSQSKVGTTAVPFLGISVGARATAMGGAFAAVSDDATSLYYNPGGFSRSGKSQFLANHINWLVDTKLIWLGFIVNLDGTNAIGLSFTQLDYGEEEVTTVLEPEGTGEKWGATDIAAAVSYARNVTDRFSVGGTIKYIQEKILNESASAFAVDVGLLFITQFNDMKLGMSISNFGTDMKMGGRDLLQRVDLDPDALGNNETIVSNLKTDSWSLPLFFRVGVAMDIIKTTMTRFTVAVDAFRPTDNTETINAGGEFAFNDWVFLRAGYKSLFREESEEGLTVGAGAQLPWGTLTCNFDYTYADFGLFENIQMIAIGIRF